MNNNDKLLAKLSNFEDLTNLEDFQIIELSDYIISSINLNKLKQNIDKACLMLSDVAPPSFMADSIYIALDNQARLEIINKLLYNYDFLKSYIKNIKSNKYNCQNDFDYIYSFVSKTMDLLKTIKEYGEFRINENEKNNIKTLRTTNNTNLLEDKK